MVDRLETGQRGLEGQKIFDRYGTRSGREQQVVQSHRLITAAAFVALLVAAVIDEKAPHRLRAERQAMGPSLPFHVPIVLKAQPRLMDERRRLKRMIPPLPSQVPTCHAAQFAVNQRKKLARRIGTLGGHSCPFATEAGNIRDALL